MYFLLRSHLGGISLALRKYVASPVTFDKALATAIICLSHAMNSERFSIAGGIGDQIVNEFGDVVVFGPVDFLHHLALVL